MAKEPGFDKVKETLQKQWDSCKITRQTAEIEKTAKRLYARKKEFYDPIEKEIGVPWYMVAVIDERESGARGGVLHNGEMIVGTGKKTRLVPAGRGPFASWKAAAIDALTMPGKNFDQVKGKWSIPLVLYCLEAYNGWGYRAASINIPSPYVWSCTNIYDDSKRGKFTSDHHFTKGVTDTQIGCAPIMKALLALDKKATPAAAATAAVVVAAGAGATATANVDPSHPYWKYWVVGTIAVAVVAGIVTYIIKHKAPIDVKTTTTES